MRSDNYLTVLLIYVNEVSFKALIHLGGESTATITALVIESQKDLEENHLETVFIKE